MGNSEAMVTMDGRWMVPWTMWSTTASVTIQPTPPPARRATDGPPHADGETLTRMPLPQSGLEPDRELPEYLADQIEQIIRDYGDPHAAAVVILERISQYLKHEGWRSPETTDLASAQIRDWMQRTGELPEHHINRDVLNSHLTELAQYVRDL